MWSRPRGTILYNPDPQRDSHDSDNAYPSPLYFISEFVDKSTGPQAVDASANDEQARDRTIVLPDQLRVVHSEPHESKDKENEQHPAS